ncbi:hypothetical protein SEA_JONJAMES_130 [Gordonia Phage JonJames]|nr:hypothetical protein SEA_JONJAMES_130 [Gordonia Phage JonJames]
MGWAVGFDSNWGRDIGYGVPSICDQPGCDERIDRGLAYVCGSDVYGGEYGCGLFFCLDHLRYVVVEEEGPDGEDLMGMPAVCDRCTWGKKPHTPTDDTREWMEWKLTDESWEPWREDHPGEVARYRRVLNGEE